MAPFDLCPLHLPEETSVDPATQQPLTKLPTHACQLTTSRRDKPNTETTKPDLTDTERRTARNEDVRRPPKRVGTAEDARVTSERTGTLALSH